MVNVSIDFVVYDDTQEEYIHDNNRVLEPRYFKTIEDAKEVKASKENTRVFKVTMEEIN